MIDGKIYATYLMASKPYGTLYIGVTGDIITRATQHRESHMRALQNDMASIVWCGLSILAKLMRLSNAKKL